MDEAPDVAVPLIAPQEFRSWIVHEDERLLVLNKSGDAVCHPSKHGPWSSVVGAAREYLGLATVHLVFRLDRETSGIIVLAKDRTTAGRLQRAVERRLVRKVYLAILEGELAAAATVNQPLGPDPGSCVTIRSRVVAPDTPGAQSAVTHFEPWAAGGGYTVARVRPETGRKHQIRVHAAWLGHAVAGDKLYGPDERLYLEFAQHGWTARHQALLPLRRQALHCAEIDLRDAREPHVFRAPWPGDLRAFGEGRLEFDPARLNAPV